MLLSQCDTFWTTAAMGSAACYDDDMRERRRGVANLQRQNVAVLGRLELSWREIAIGWLNDDVVIMSSDIFT
jgi:hypothetical protein